MSLELTTEELTTEELTTEELQKCEILAMLWRTSCLLKESKGDEYRVEDDKYRVEYNKIYDCIPDLTQISTKRKNKGKKIFLLKSFRVNGTILVYQVKLKNKTLDELIPIADEYLSTNTNTE